jgi:hypothetical protein
MQITAQQTLERDKSCMLHSHNMSSSVIKHTPKTHTIMPDWHNTTQLDTHLSIGLAVEAALHAQLHSQESSWSIRRTMSPFFK